MKLFIEISKEEFAKIDKIKLEHFAITDQGKKRFFVECGINLKDIKYLLKEVETLQKAIISSHIVQSEQTKAVKVISEQLINLTELFLKHTREKQ